MCELFIVDVAGGEVLVKLMECRTQRLFEGRES
jgi:hypothetical protein